MKLNVGVFFGGRSVEHEISIITAVQAMAAIDHSRYRVFPIYVAKDDVWYHSPEMSQIESFYDIPKLTLNARQVAVEMTGKHHRIVMLKKHFWQRKQVVDLDLAFPIMHGTCGEDGTIQGFLELMNIPYVGCGVLSSAIGMDKIATKWAMRNIGIEVPDDYWFYSNRWLEEKSIVLQELRRKKFLFPMIVKPANLGSSIGVQEVNDDSELEAAIDVVVRLSNRVLIEPKISHLREINCAALGDHENVITSVCEEPVASGGILSYQDKYQGESQSKLSGNRLTTNKLGAGLGTRNGMSDAKREIPAKISSELAREIKLTTQTVFRSLDCHGVIRVDYLWDEQNHKLYLCEINTIPGSMAFYLWDYEGIDYSELIERLFELALKRFREQQNLVRTFDSNVLKQ